MQVMIGLHIGRAAIPSGRGKSKYNKINAIQPGGPERLQRAINAGKRIQVYTDASYYKNREEGAYGWVAGIQTVANFTPLVHGGGRERGANNIARKMSSTRLEKLALLAAATHLATLGCMNAQYHADNTSANKWFNTRHRLLHPLYAWQKSSSNDLDAALQHLTKGGYAHLQGSHRAVHIKGHVEGRKKDATKWSMHEQGNHMADAIAECIHNENPYPIQPQHLARTQRTTVTWDGNEITDRLNRSIEVMLGEQYLREYMIERPDIWGDNLDQHEFTRMTGHRRLTTLRAHAFHCKFVFGMLATRAEVYKKGGQQKPTDPTSKAPPSTPIDTRITVTDSMCTLTDACHERQTNWHIFAQCTHPPLVVARKKWATNTAKVVGRAMYPRDDPKDSQDAAYIDKKGKPRQPDHTTLNRNVAIPIRALLTLNSKGCISSAWKPDTTPPALINAMRENPTPAEIATVLGQVGRTGARAWWKGSWSSSFTDALTMGGLSGRRANSVLAGMETVHAEGWKEMYSIYRTEQYGTPDTRKGKIDAQRATENKIIDGKITLLYEQRPTAAFTHTPLPTRLAESLTRKQGWYNSRISEFKQQQARSRRPPHDTRRKRPRK